MALRDRIVAARRHRKLIELLGGKCQDPLCEDGTNLQVHHLDGRDWEVTRVEQSRRVSRYWREYRAGVRLGVLCRKCNGAARNNPRRPTSPNDREEAF